MSRNRPNTLKFAAKKTAYETLNSTDYKMKLHNVNALFFSL